MGGIVAFFTPMRRHARRSRSITPLAQALRQWVSQPALRQSMGEAGRKLAL